MLKSVDNIYDLVGIGVGPFNLSLAALANPINELKTIFFDKNVFFNWHPGLLLQGTTLQVPFMADMVSLAQPSHPLSFLQYLQQHNRLYKFYFLENFHISRNEYNHYCQWVSQQLPSVNFQHCVEEIDIKKIGDQAFFRLTVKDLGADLKQNIFAKNIALGLGTVPNIPASISIPDSDFIQHSANYGVFHSKQLKTAHSVCVVGSGQSAAEIVLDLLSQQYSHPLHITWITRAKGFFPMEYSKLGLEHFSPEYMTYFYSLNAETRRKLITQQDLMYKGISQKTIADIFDKLYELTIANKPQPLDMMANNELQAITQNAATNTHRFTLHFKQLQTDAVNQVICDAVILATGYRSPQINLSPDLLKQVILDEHQRFSLNEDFSVKTQEPLSIKIFVQNDSLYSHGIGSPDLGLGCYRNSVILNTITKRECYPVNAKNVFQTFTPYRMDKAIT